MLVIALILIRKRQLPGQPPTQVIKKKILHPQKMAQTSHKKKSTKMYTKLGMPNREKQPKQDWNHIRFTHIAIPTSFHLLLPSPHPIHTCTSIYPCIVHTIHTSITTSIIKKEPKIHHTNSISSSILAMSTLRHIRNRHATAPPTLCTTVPPTLHATAPPHTCTIIHNCKHHETTMQQHLFQHQLPLHCNLPEIPMHTTCKQNTHTYQHNSTHTLSTSINKKLKRCRDGNVCEAYVIPVLFGLFLTVCHPYICVHFVKKCFFVTCNH